MTRILFVDDETKILDGMKRSLHRMRNEWTMEFVLSGQEALAALEKNPADVVVSDMRMPTMDGWQLLAEIKKMYPKTVRFILSGHADPQSIMRAVGTAHQYLSKPCDSESLTNAVKQTQMLRNLLTDNRFEQLVGQVGMLPSPPAAFQELLSCLQEPNSTTADAARIVSRDISMTANIMKLVNSAFFGSRQPIVSADRAVAYLGLETLGALVLGHSVFDTQCPVSDVSGVNMKQLWLHSIETATVARQIAIAEKWSAQKIEEAYLAGVLHDVGKIVFATQIAPLPGSRATAGPDLKMESHHAEVGAYLLSLWGFPTSIVEAVAFHHNPGSVDVDRLGLPGLIHIANHLANALDGRGSPDCVLDEEFIERLGLSDHLAHWATIASATLGKQVDQ